MEQISKTVIGSPVPTPHKIRARRHQAQVTLGVSFVLLLLFTVWHMVEEPRVAYSAQDLATLTAGQDGAALSAALPAATPTVIGTPDPVRVRASTISVPAGAVTATVPLDIIVLADRVNVGLLSAAIAYDATLLTATGCAQGATLDLLLCNVTTPGIIQLAGVSALGIRNESTIAALTFDVAQNVDRNVPLSVTIKRLGDGNGTSVAATAVDGALDLDCAPDVEVCERGTNIYLPLIRR